MPGRRVLVVEDDALIRLILVESLADEGYQIVEAGTGDEAVRLIEGSDGFHLVVTDIQMPGTIDGLAVGAHAKQRDGDIPVIYVTGRPESMVGVSLGPHDAFVRKPYGPREIVATVERLLQER